MSNTYSRKYYEENKDMMRINMRIWQTKRRERFMEYNRMKIREYEEKMGIKKENKEEGW